MNKKNLARESKSVSIVIVSWNTRELLRACLDTIRSQTGLQDLELVETIVVDNNSTDGSVGMLRQNYPEVALIENSDNVGFARATNQGVNISRGSNILFLNPDTKLTEHAISILLRTLLENPSAGVVGSRLVDPNGQLQDSAYPSIQLFREFWRLFHLDQIVPVAVYPLKQWEHDRPHRVDVVQGASLLVRKDALDEVGLLDEDYFMYTEEVDLCYRLAQAGWEIFWEPRAVVIHYGGQSTRLHKTEMFLKLYESKILFFRKHKGWLLTSGYKSLLFFASMPRIITGWLGEITGIRRQKEFKERTRNYLQLLRRLPSI